MSMHGDEGPLNDGVRLYKDCDWKDGEAIKYIKQGVKNEGTAVEPSETHQNIWIY